MTYTIPAITCPTWCTEVHDDWTSAPGLAHAWREHRRTTHDGIRLTAIDHAEHHPTPGGWTTTAGETLIQITGQTRSPHTARAYAYALLEAADLAEDHSTAPDPWQQEATEPAPF